MGLIERKEVAVINRDGKPVLGVKRRLSDESKFEAFFEDSLIWEEIELATVYFLGSPRFYAEYEPDVNRKHFAEDPKYFIEAYLYQVYRAKKRKYPPVKQIQDFLTSQGIVSDTEMPKVWIQIENLFQTPDGPRFAVSSLDTFEFRVSSELAEKVDALEKESKPATQAETSDLKVSELISASAGATMDTDFEAAVADLAGYLALIDFDRIDTTTISAFERGGSEAAQLLVVAITFLWREEWDSQEPLAPSLWLRLLREPTGLGPRTIDLLNLALDSGEHYFEPAKFVSYALALAGKDSDFQEALLRRIRETAAHLMVSLTSIASSAKGRDPIALYELVRGLDWASEVKLRILGWVAESDIAFIEGIGIFENLDPESAVSLSTNVGLTNLLRNRALTTQLRERVAELCDSATSSASVLGLLRLQQLHTSLRIQEKYPYLLEKAILSDEALDQTWREISGAVTIDNLHRELSATKEALTIASSSLDDAKGQLKEALEHGASLAERLSKSESSAHQDLDAIRATAKLDALRAVVSMLAAINDTVAVDKDKILELIKPNLSRLGITQIGIVGNRIAFDAEIHSDPNALLRQGDLAQIVSPGFMAESSGNKVILRKALVTGG
jgi:hypothetical protein